MNVKPLVLGLLLSLCASANASGQPELFRNAVAAALAQNPTMREAQAAYLAAQNDIRQASGQRLPQVDITVQSKPQQFGTNADNGAVKDESTGALRAVTPVFDWGKASNEIESREQAAESAKQRMIQVRESVAAETVNAILQVAKQMRLSSATDQYMARNQELVDMLTQIVGIDRGRTSELVQARSRLLQASASKDQTQARLREARHALMRLLPDQTVEIPINLVETAIPLIDLNAALNLLDNHPGVAQAQAEAKAALASAQAIGRANLPALSWVVSKSTAKDVQNRESPWTSQFQLSYGAFRGGSAVAAQRSALARADASAERARQIRLDVEYRIRGLSEDAKAQIDRARAYRELMPQTDQIREAFYEQWYTLGKRSLFDLLSAESDHFNTVSIQINSLFDGLAGASRLQAEAASLTSWLGLGDTSNVE